MGGGGKKKPKVQQVVMPTAPAPAPPPEETAMAPTIADEDALRSKNRESKRLGTSALRIALASNAGLNTPGGGSGLNLPK
jgi:hypothetical protein